MQLRRQDNVAYAAIADATTTDAASLQEHVATNHYQTVAVRRCSFSR